MGVRSVRLSDLLAIHALADDAAAQVLSPPIATSPAATMVVGLLSSWPAMGYQAHTLVLSRGSLARGFVQARALPGRESWQLLRLACVAADPDGWEQACSTLIDRICAVTAQRGALRTFARVAADSDQQELLNRSAFRPYASEVTLAGTLRDLMGRSSSTGHGARPYQAADAWDLFSLYCAVTPALVRHAEGRSRREWAAMNEAATHLFRRWRPVRTVVLGEPGRLDIWLRWYPPSRRRPQVMEVLVRPDATLLLGEVVRVAVESQGLDADCATICRAREYDGRLSATLEEAGFSAVARDTLLVRHTVARATERQLLIAALRAQGLGIDISQYRRGVESAHQRLASSREAVHHVYDRYDRDYGASYHG